MEAIIEDDYVSFEVAKLLNIKGFKGEFRKHYWGYVTGKEFLTESSFNPEYDYPAPTLHVAMKWLREVHHRHINIIQQWLPSGYRFSIENLDKGYFYTICGSDVYKTYEEACEEALKVCLKKLI